MLYVYYVYIYIYVPTDDYVHNATVYNTSNFVCSDDKTLRRKLIETESELKLCHARSSHICIIYM